jgi:hypothetical protein
MTAILLVQNGPVGSYLVVDDDDDDDDDDDVNTKIRSLKLSHLATKTLYFIVCC